MTTLNYISQDDLSLYKLIDAKCRTFNYECIKPSDILRDSQHMHGPAFSCTLVQCSDVSPSSLISVFYIIPVYDFSFDFDHCTSVPSILHFLLYLKLHFTIVYDCYFYTSIDAAN